ncbi:MAG: apolipoprotein N-acyltransferase [Oceanidesulfovibrio sp.]
MTRRDTALAGLAIAALSFLGFANPVWHVPAAALALPGGLFCIALASPGPKAAFVRGLLVGGFAYSLSLYWVAVPVHDYGLLPWALAAPCPLLLGLAMGGYTGVFSVLAHTAGQRMHPLLAVLAAGVFWGALEGLRGVLFTGFTWLCLPSAFVPWPAMLQTASIIGAQGLAAVLAGLACLPAAALLQTAWKRGARIAMCVAAAGGLLLLWLIGANGPLAPLEPLGTVRAALVQGNIDQSRKWDPTYQRETVDRYLGALGRLAAKAEEPLDIVVWPETSMPFYFQEDSILSLRVRQMADDLDVALLLGSPGYERDDGVLYYYNRAFLLDADGETAGVYDKEHLVPFGEYIPFGQYLPLDKLVHGVGDFVSGTDAGPLTLPADGLRERLRLGLLICYETIFPELARARVAKGSTILVNISNDAWFGNTSAPMQHLHLSALRAVEQGRTLLRATNTGISAIVDPAGRIRAATPLFEEAAIVSEVALHDGQTPYGRYGGIVLPVLAGMGIVLMFYAVRRKPRA